MEALVPSAGFTWGRLTWRCSNVRIAVVWPSASQRTTAMHTHCQRVIVWVRRSKTEGHENGAGKEPVTKRICIQISHFGDEPVFCSPD
jgi:hypothetical protein